MGRRKLTPAQRVEICKRYLNGEKQKDLAIAYNVTAITIHNVIRNKGLANTHSYNKGRESRVISLRIDIELFNRVNEYANPSVVAEQALKWYLDALDQQKANQ